MREDLRKDGAVVLTGDDDDQDQVVVEGIVTAFSPVRGNAHCLCGAELHRWNLRPTADGAEFSCSDCHRVQGRLEVGVKVYR